LRKRLFTIYKNFILLFGDGVESVSGAQPFMNSQIYYLVAPTKGGKAQTVRWLLESGWEQLPPDVFLDTVAKQLFKFKDIPSCGAQTLEMLKRKGVK